MKAAIEQEAKKLAAATETNTTTSSGLTRKKLCRNFYIVKFLSFLMRKLQKIKLCPKLSRPANCKVVAVVAVNPPPS